MKKNVLELAVGKLLKGLERKKLKLLELANLAAELNFKRLRKEIFAEQKFKRLSKKKN
jgi:hypothetical protein